MDSVLVDLRSALRAIRHDAGYAVAVVATLALTLGPATAIFSIVDGVILRPLAFPESQELVSIREVVPSLARQYPTLPANGRHFEYWRDRLTAFQAIAMVEWRRTTLLGAGDPAQVSVVRASGSFFDVLHAGVSLGRPLTRDDERADRPAVAVISHRLWEDRFGRDPNILGRTVSLGGTQHTIVGVLPPGSEVPTFDVLGESASLGSSFAAVVPFRINFDNVGWMGTFNYPVIARLKPEVTVTAARAELDVLQQAVAQLATAQLHEPAALRSWVMPLEESIVGRARLGLWLLLLAIGGVVLIACANLANLSLTRALGRVRDAAVRSALGAGRARLVRSAVLEQLILASAGGAVGVVLARAGLDIFVRTAPIALPRVNHVVIDGRVVAFAAVLAVATGLSVALLPAWRIGRVDLRDTLRAGGHGSTDRSGRGLRAGLLAAQIALSLTLLVITGLFVTSFVKLVHVDPGFSPDRALAVEIAPPGRRYAGDAARTALYDRILERVRGLPGIAAAAWTSSLPLTGETWVDAVVGAGDTRPASQQPSANYRFIGPEYFRALGMPMTAGRSVDERDRPRSVVPAVVSARVARTVWPGQDPIGRQFTRGNPDAHYEVVGVVADAHATSLEAESPLMVYVPYWSNNEGKSVLLIRTAGDASALAADLRRVVREVDPEIAIADISPLRAVVDRALESRRYQMWLFLAFGAVALLIASVGVYATTAYDVSRRRREMNIRVALGAQRSQVLALVLRQGATPLLIGMALGCAGAAASGTLIGSLLFEVRPGDPRVIAGVVTLVAAVALLASTTAARQALRIEPAAALRGE